MHKCQSLATLSGNCVSEPNQRLCFAPCTAAHLHGLFSIRGTAPCMEPTPMPHAAFASEAIHWLSWHHAPSHRCMVLWVGSSLAVCRLDPPGTCGCELNHWLALRHAITCTITKMHGVSMAALRCTYCQSLSLRCHGMAPHESLLHFCMAASNQVGTWQSVDFCSITGGACSHAPSQSWFMNGQHIAACTHAHGTPRAV